MAASTMPQGKSRKRTEKRNSVTDSDSSSDEYSLKSECTGTSSRSKKKRITDRSVEIPSETCKWSPQVLHRLRLYWNSDVDKPSNLVRRFMYWTTRDEPTDFEKKLGLSFSIEQDFIVDLLNFDIDMNCYSKVPDIIGDYPGESDERRKAVKELEAGINKIEDDFNSLKLLKAKCASQLEAAGSELSGRKKRILAYSGPFIEIMKQLLFRVKNKDFSKVLPETSFVDILLHLCTVCGLHGTFDIAKRKYLLEGVLVTAVPDLIFVKTCESINQTKKQTAICVAEVKKKDYDFCQLHKERRQTRSSSLDESKMQQKLLPSEIVGSSQHVGQLLLECIHNSRRVSFGIMCTGTKVMMTCLRLSENYMENNSEKANLEYEDHGNIFYSDLFDILRAAERKEIVKALLMLGCVQETTNQDHLKIMLG